MSNSQQQVPAEYHRQMMEQHQKQIAAMVEAERGVRLGNIDQATIESIARKIAQIAWQYVEAKIKTVESTNVPKLVENTPQVLRDLHD